MDDRVTVITNIFNEEYLLPFWLNYHKRIFDHGIVIDYDSTDSSVEIIKKICPNWEIRRTINIIDGKPIFETFRIEEECKNIELSITSGYKIYLNTTEWLILNKPIKDILEFKTPNKCYLLNVFLPLYNITDYNPKNTEEFIENFKHLIVKTDTIRGSRFIFNRSHGDYQAGRHFTNVKSDYDVPKSYNSLKDCGLCIFWCGYYPINDIFWNRKLNVKKNMDINIEKNGTRNTSRQHFFSIEEMKNEYTNYLKKENFAHDFLDSLTFCKNMLIEDE